MDVNLINPFLDAVANVMPQLGFHSVSSGKLGLKDQHMDSLGVTLLVGISNQVQGNVAYNMTEETARQIASTMMMGMPVDVFDDMAQSAVSELANMLAANAAIRFESLGISANISPPSLIVGDNFKAKLSNERFISVQMLIDGNVVEVNIGVET
ncbi:MAG: chemotaxis protein CheX [Solirubrobacterales bacterium]